MCHPAWMTADPAVDQLAELIDTHALGLAAAVGLDVHQLAQDRASDAAARLVAELRANDDGLSRQAAVTVLGLHPDEDDPAWWSTPLGLLVARHDGSGPAVTQMWAAHVLGVTRGTISQMVARGNLDRHPDGGVLRSAVLQRLACRR